MILWAKRNLDRGFPTAYQNLLNLEHIQRIYLDEIDSQTTPSLGISILQFILTSPKKAPQQVQSLINQTRQQTPEGSSQKNVIELIEKIIIYKFPHKSRQELEAMFNLTEWKQTKFYQEAKQEGEQKGEIKGKLKTVPLLLKLGLTTEQIAQDLELDLEVVTQYLASQDN